MHYQCKHCMLCIFSGNAISTVFSLLMCSSAFWQQCLQAFSLAVLTVFNPEVYLIRVTFTFITTERVQRKSQNLVRKDKEKK